MKKNETTKVINSAGRGRPKKLDIERDSRKFEIWAKILKEINK